MRINICMRINIWWKFDENRTDFERAVAIFRKPTFSVPTAEFSSHWQFCGDFLLAFKSRDLVRNV
jgi:hypothetical protein